MDWQKKQKKKQENLKMKENDEVKNVSTASTYLV